MRCLNSRNLAALDLFGKTFSKWTEMLRTHNSCCAEHKSEALLSIVIMQDIIGKEAFHYLASLKDETSFEKTISEAIAKMESDIKESEKKDAETVALRKSFVQAPATA